MKNSYFLVLVLCCIGFGNAQIVNIPDANFKDKLLSANYSNSIAFGSSGNIMRIDTNYDGEIQQSEALAIYKLKIFGLTHQSSGQIINTGISDLTGVSAFTNLTYLQCTNGLISSLNLDNLVNLTYLDCGFNDLNSLSINNVNNLNFLDCKFNRFTSLPFNNLINLTSLDCDNNQFTSLPINGLTNLTYLKCDSNQLTSLNLNNLINLTSLSCAYGNITTLNVSNLANLSYLYCPYNSMTSLNLIGAINLSYLGCYHNNIESLNLSNFVNLTELNCSFNNTLDTLILTNTTNLINLNCSYNRLNTLNLSDSINLVDLNCSSNRLQSLFIKNGKNENTLNLSGNSLSYICADEFQLYNLGVIMSGYTNNGYYPYQINSYCTFEPGGVFYTIQGNNKYDANNNGCDALDNLYPYLNYNITNGNTSGSLISNTTGNYSIPVPSGTQIITPILENPTYFTVSPSNFAVTFPTQASPFTQNFCITANGVHPDLEINLLPTVMARPGFDAKYKLTYKNKGNTVQSGTVNVNFNDALLDFLSSTQAVTTQTLNNLSWAFTSLQPLETREITFTLKVNSPTQIPAVNNGTILNYVATITSPATDEMPSDNTFVYNQTVVNSFDPNDKTCLEGATISQAKVGDYVHYMIRFENNGTANAQNIVVKDVIDTAKFDINSIVPIKGSHSFVTNITSGNKVEFIFENIQLPFATGTNQGFIAFKIKTKSTLVNGNTFSNTASIYFDYNFPIITNTATTTIQTLKNQDFEFGTYFSLYPNPVKDVLTVDFKQTIEVKSINIYNTLGQLVLVVPNAQDTNAVDVSNLTSGNYFIKINSDKGASTSKFIKL